MARWPYDIADEVLYGGICGSNQFYKFRLKSGYFSLVSLVPFVTNKHDLKVTEFFKSFKSRSGGNRVEENASETLALTKYRIRKKGMKVKKKTNLLTEPNDHTMWRTPLVWKAQLENNLQVEKGL